MIKKDNNGTYFVQVYYVDAIDGKGKYKKKRGFQTRREAVKYEAELKLSKNIVHGCTMSFLSMAHEWELSLDVSEGIKKQHQEHFNIRFKDYKDLPIDKFTKPMLMKWRNELSEMPFFTSTKNRTMMFVRSTFKYANDVYNVPNVATCLRSFKKTDEEIMTEEMQIWDINEFVQFESAITNTLYRDFFHLLYWTGMRRGEAIALQCNDVDGCWINIRYSQRDATTGLKPTKTRTSRKIKLDDVTAQIIADRIKISGSGYVFGGKYAVAPTTIDRMFRKGIKDSGVKPIRLHDLRHSHASWLINHGVNIVAVSKRLGHADIQTTLSNYTHLLNETDNNMMENLNELAHSVARSKQNK